MKRMSYIAGGCAVILLVLFLGFDPNRVPSFVLVLPFILLFSLLFIGISLLLEQRGTGRSKRLKIAGLCASLPTLLLVLQSIGQLTVRDVLTTALLFGLSYFYISRAATAS